MSQFARRSRGGRWEGVGDTGSQAAQAAGEEGHQERKHQAG